MKVYANNGVTGTRKAGGLMEEIYFYIEGYKRGQFGKSPSVSEIAAHVKRARSYVWYCLQAMDEAGWIKLMGKPHSRNLFIHIPDSLWIKPNEVTVFEDLLKIHNTQEMGKDGFRPMRLFKPEVTE